MQPKWGRQELRLGSGYVIVHNRTPGANYLTVRKEIQEESDSIRANRVELDGITGWLRSRAD